MRPRDRHVLYLFNMICERSVPFVPFIANSAALRSNNFLSGHTKIPGILFT